MDDARIRELQGWADGKCTLTDPYHELCHWQCRVTRNALPNLLAENAKLREMVEGLAGALRGAKVLFTELTALELETADVDAIAAQQKEVVTKIDDALAKYEEDGGRK